MLLSVDARTGEGCSSRDTHSIHEQSERLMQSRARPFSVGICNGMEWFWQGDSWQTDIALVYSCIYIYLRWQSGRCQWCIELRDRERRTERESERKTDHWASMSFELVAFIILWPSDCGKSSFNIFGWISKKVRPQQHHQTKRFNQKESATERKRRTNTPNWY